MKRREFLENLSSLIALAASGGIPGLIMHPVPARALDGQLQRFFILIRMTGGWDVTLGLDPQQHSDGSDQNDMFIEYRPDEILRAAGIPFAPACAPLLPYASNLAVINGVFMSSLNVSHEGNLDYMSTGDDSGHSPDLSVEIANSCPSGPMGVVFDGTLKKASRRIMPTTVSNLLALKDSVDFKDYQSFIEKNGGDADFKRSLLMLAQNDDIRLKFVDAIRGLDGSDGAVLAAAFFSGATKQAQIDINMPLDTHSGHEKNHLKNQLSGWKSVAEIFKIFKQMPAVGVAGSSLFDQTTFMVMSEFSRTPFLNASKGKDHNPLTNSVLLAGGGVKGGQVLGQSRRLLRAHAKSGQAQHVASLINFRTGIAAKTIDEAQGADFNFIFPENIVATVATILGADRGKFSSIPADTAALERIIR